VDVGDGVCQGIPPAVSAAEFTSTLWLTHPDKNLIASEVNHVDSTINVRANRMCRRLYVGK
jgi:hypothetical protein